MPQYIVMRPDEAEAFQRFRFSCVRHGLSIQLSNKQAFILRMIIEGTRNTKESKELDRLASTRSFMGLESKGFIRSLGNGRFVQTELGLLALGLAVAGGIIEGHTIEHTNRLPRPRAVKAA